MLRSAGSSFLPDVSSSDKQETSNNSNNNNNSNSSSDAAAASEDKSQCCFGLIDCSSASCGDCCSNFHVVVGIVLLSWFIALFVDGTVGASCLVVAVIISSLRRFVDFLCDSCSTQCEKSYCSGRNGSD